MSPSQTAIRHTLATLAIVAASIACTSTAHAQTTQDGMSRHMHRYFRGELDLAATALGFAAGSGYIGGALLAQATDATRAAAVPVLAVGVGELAIAIGLMVRTGPQVRHLDRQIAEDPAGYARDEAKRMDRILSNFVLLRAIETVVIVAGAGTALAGIIADEDRATGAGLGLAAQGVVVLSFDALADARAERYRHAIENFSASPLIAPSPTGGVYGVTAGGSF